MKKLIQYLKLNITKLALTIVSTLVCFSSCSNVAYAQTYDTATGTITGNGVCSLYPDSCKTDQHREMGSNWSSADKSFTQNHDHFGWLGALQAEHTSYTAKDYGTGISNAVYYVSVKDALMLHGDTTTQILTVNDVHMIIGNNSNDTSYDSSQKNILYTANQVQEGSDYVFNYTLSPSSTGLGVNANNTYTAVLYSDVAYNNTYYSSTEAIYNDFIDRSSSRSSYRNKTPGSTESSFITSMAFVETLPTLYYNPTYDIFEGLKIVNTSQAVSYTKAPSINVKFDLHREVYVRAIFLRGGSTYTWTSGLNSPGSLYNPNTGLGRTLHGVVNQLDFYPALFTSDQYDWTDGGNGEIPHVASGTWVQPNSSSPTTGRIITDKYPSPLYGTNSLAMLLREYDNYYKGGKDVLNHHANSLILYMNVNKVNLDSGSSEFDTYIIFFKDGDYVDLENDNGKLKIEERLIITGGNIDVYTLHNGSAPISKIDYYDTFGNDLPYGLETISLLPHPFPVYNEQGLVETYWNAYEAAYNGETTDGEYYLNIYCSAVGFNFLNLSSMYNAESGYTMLDIFWPGASMSEAAGCESVGINDYGKRVDGGPNVGAYVNTTEGNSIYGQESYNQLDGSSLAEFASTITNLDTTIDGYADTMKNYITTYTSFLQSDYPLMSKTGFLSTSASMKLWIDGLLANQYISPFVDTVLLIVIVIIAIR